LKLAIYVKNNLNGLKTYFDIDKFFMRINKLLRKN